MKKVRLGIVGVGAQGGLYASMLTGVNLVSDRPLGFDSNIIPNMELGALCDTDSKKKELCEEKLPNIPFYESYIDMLESGNVDAVVTTLPHYDHTVVAMEALKRDIHVISEKPAGAYTKQVLRT